MPECYHRPCGRFFTGLSAFDRHLTMSKTQPFTTCKDPEAVGLVMHHRSTREVWGFPPPDSPVVG